MQCGQADPTPYTKIPRVYRERDRLVDPLRLRTPLGEGKGRRSEHDERICLKIVEQSNCQYSERESDVKCENGRE